MLHRTVKYRYYCVSLAAYCRVLATRRKEGHPAGQGCAAGWHTLQASPPSRGWVGHPAGQGCAAGLHTPQAVASSVR